MNLRLKFILLTCFLFDFGETMGLANKELEVQKIGVVVAASIDLISTQVQFTLEEDPVVQLAASCIPELFPEQRVYRRTQLLFNEPVIILEEKNGWYKVRAMEQLVIDRKGSRGCLGWVKAENIRIVDKPATEINLVVTALRGVVYANSLLSSESAIMNFSCGTKLKGDVHDAQSYKVQLLGDAYGFIAASDVCVQEEIKRIHVDALRKKIAQQALQFLPIPYIWGGRNAQGVDCSALIQLAYLSCGVTVPRYAHGQWMACKPVELNQLQQGDLIFLGAIRDDQLVMIHVMLYLGGDMLLEAHGFLGKVRLIDVCERLGKPLKELRNGDSVLLRRFIYGGRFIE